MFAASNYSLNLTLANSLLVLLTNPISSTYHKNVHQFFSNLIIKNNNISFITSNFNIQLYKKFPNNVRGFLCQIIIILPYELLNRNSFDKIIRGSSTKKKNGTNLLPDNPFHP